MKDNSTPPLYARYEAPQDGLPGFWITYTSAQPGAELFVTAAAGTPPLRGEMEMTMSYRTCRKCGYDEGLHHYQTMQCPVGGEAPIGRKQEWMTQTFEEKDESSETIENLLREKSALQAANAELTDFVEDARKWFGDFCQHAPITFGGEAEMGLRAERLLAKVKVQSSPQGGS